jgi:hypothetical protein
MLPRVFRRVLPAYCTAGRAHSLYASSSWMSPRSLRRFVCVSRFRVWTKSLTYKLGFVVILVFSRMGQISASIRQSVKLCSLRYSLVSSRLLAKQQALHSRSLLQPCQIKARRCCQSSLSRVSAPETAKTRQLCATASRAHSDCLSNYWLRLCSWEVWA